MPQKEQKGSYAEFAIVTADNHNEVWGLYYTKDRAQERIDTGYLQNFMHERDKHKKLIVIPYERTDNKA